MLNKPIRIFNISYSSRDRARIHQLVDEVIDEAFLTNHTLCRRLESFVNQLQGSSHSIAASSATSALEAVFRTIDVNKRVVITQANTFIATAHAIHSAGGIILPLDLDSEYVASLSDLLSCIDYCENNNLNIGAVCIVHIAGRASSDLIKIKEILKIKNIPLVEDNAQGFLSTLNENFLGNIGDFSVTSFQTTKVVACGEGGIISTQSEQDSKQIRNNIFYGKSDDIPRLFDKNSGNFKLSELNAALALADLERCKERIERRREINNKYKELVHSKFLHYLQAPINNNPSYYKTVFLAKNIEIRQKIEEFFKTKDISMTGSVYREPISMQPRIIKSSSYIKRDLPNTNDFCSLHFAPPNYPELLDEEVEVIIDALNSFQP